jgi:hypothetical protein
MIFMSMAELSEMAKTYRQAEEMVLKRYATESGEKGQSQAWKIPAIRDDRKNGHLDTSVLDLFQTDVEKEVNRLLAMQPIVVEIPKKASEPKKLVAVEPPQPHGGLDLNWD